MFSFKFEFGQITGLKSFSSISVDSNEPSDGAINGQNQNSNLPKVKVVGSVVQNPDSPEKGKRNRCNVSSKSVVLHSWMISNKLIWSVTKSSTLTSGIAEWNASQIYVWVSIGSYKFKETGENITSVVTQGSEFRAAGIWMADKELNQQSWNFKESIQEWSSNNATPVFAN